MWDERYSDEDYAYGTEPNDFLVEAAHYLPAGRILCIGEGEGRNAVWLTGQGYQVTALDNSSVGLGKAQQLARSRGTSIETVHADLAEYIFEEEHWDGVVSIFCHLPPELRKKVHRRLVSALRPGGVLVLEAYTPDQLELGTGGPAVKEMTMDLEGLEAELKGLSFVHGKELQRPVNEGKYHNGIGSVVQVVGIKPA
jgi:SAM-dependent methyltransferase